MEHQEAETWQVAGRGTAGDDAERFLHELRQLRDGAGLGHAELAARAHYPYDSIKAAEVGPSLPDLPVLSAFVRGCGGTAEEWEERWRRLTRTPSLPVAASRDAGNSAAATAGARIGAVTQVVDAPDPSVIIAALNRVAEEMAGGPDTDADPVAVPPQPAYPEDASIADVSLPDLSLPDLSMDAFAADPPELSTFSAFTPVTAADATTAGPLTGSLADSLAGTDKPGVDDRPKGWDPIRVSAAWPAIGSDTAAPAAAGAATGSAAGPVVRQSAWSRGVNASGEPAGVARPGSRARALIVAVVLVCVLAVVLAIFA